MEKLHANVPVYLKVGDQVTFNRTIVTGEKANNVNQPKNAVWKRVIGKGEVVDIMDFEIGLCSMSMKGAVKRKMPRKFFRRRHRDQRAKEGRRNTPQKTKRFEHIKQARRESIKN